MALLEYRPSQTLFKYCSLEGFFGILRSKRLWFSDLSSANDPRELRLGYEHFIDALKSVRHNEYQGEGGFFLSIIAGRLAPYHENLQAFCCCFSLAADELPMWGAYGANYSGLAIGFRPTALFDIPARIQKVAYLDENTADGFRRVVLDMAARFDATRNRDDLDYWVSATVSALAAMTALKHSTWAYEREIRQVHMQRIQPPEVDSDQVFSVTGVLPNDEPVEWTKPSERVVGDRSVSYLEFPFGRLRKGGFDPARAVEKVVIGPNCALSPEDVTATMQEYGFESFEVRRSVCEIR